jgi:DNA polymerase III subunit delta'
MYLPWQEQQWQSIWQAKVAQRLPHALLLTGIHGTGKAQFLQAMLYALLCTQVSKQGLPCESCHACHLLKLRTHPSVLWIEPEKAGSAIKVDQIRELAEFTQQSALQGTYRIVILQPAEAMNINAANALLKTLEEPSSDVHLILLSEQGKRLPATILSRCQRILFPPPPNNLALSWLNSKIPENCPVAAELLLRLAHGAPLAALALAQGKAMSARQLVFDTLLSLSEKNPDPVASAANLQDQDAIKLIDSFLSWSMDLSRLQLGAGQQIIINQDYVQSLINLQRSISMRGNLQFMAYLQKLRQMLAQGINLNKQLWIESVLIRWCTLCAT